MADGTPPPPVHDRSREPHPARACRTATRAAAGTAIVGVATLIVAVLQPSMNGSHSFARPKCSSNEHQLGLAILLYQQDHGGHYPDSLAAILSAEQIGPEVLVCPSSTDTAAALPPPPAGEDRPTTRQAAAALTGPGHLSYVYFGHPDWTDATVPADAVVIGEPVSNHAGDGSNLLFGDGHAEWVPMPRAARLIAAATATTQPVSAASVP